MRRVLDETVPEVPPAQLPVQMRDFPHGACGDATMLLGAYLVDSGISGFEYVNSQRPYGGDWWCHSWLQRGDLVVDITADQFSDAPGPVIVDERSGWHSVFDSDHDQGGVADFRRASGDGLYELTRLYTRMRPLLFE